MIDKEVVRSMSNKPFLLKPAVKDYLWGGSRLNDDFNLGFDIDPFAVFIRMEILLLSVRTRLWHKF